VQPDQASFFMMSPLPGSRDHRSMTEDGALMEADYNRFDCFHETTSHPYMKDGAWTRAYAEAWRRFYCLENMKAILSRTNPERYWDVFFNLFWYKNSFVNEGMHPMLAGLFRWKDRESRRACFQQESRLAHLRRRIPEIYKFLRGTLRVALEMEELWLATRKRSETEIRVIAELEVVRAGLRGHLLISDLQAAYARAKTRFPSIEVPSRLSLFRERASLLRVSSLRQSRSDLARFWIDVRRRLRRGQSGTVLWTGRIALNALRELRLAAGFVAALMTGGKAHLDHRSPEAGLDICPVPPADIGGYHSI
jgi:hypothetical protein